MSLLKTQEFEVPVAGGELAVARLGDAGDGSPPVLAVHGITASNRSWLAVARALEGRASLVAVDLRGRGRSSELSPPYGMAEHVADAVAVLDRLELDRCVVVGHSLGAYIVARLAADHPERVRSAILVDGGLTIPGTERIDPQAFADALIGPALARLRLKFPNREAYRDWWRAHPAIAGGDVDDQDLVAYADYDLIGDEPEMHSCISEPAVRADVSELAGMGAAATRMTVPATLLCAPRGLQGEPKPMQPLSLVEAWVAQAPDRRRGWQVPDVNHYTLAFGAAGARVVAAEIASAATSG
jgi:pimeloyl-ACP methyl ester carboxylesterase